MPNTLAHIAVHGLVTRRFISGADLRWIALGCIIPDLPWIFRRIAIVVVPQLVEHDFFGLYFLAQASLAISLLLGVVFALFSPNFKRTFLILALGVLLHLLLDACQEKWGNGVLLFVPFSWDLVSFDLFRIESIPTYFLTAAGLLYLLVAGRRAVEKPLRLTTSPPRLIAVGAAVMLYALLPFVMLDQMFEANTGYCQTWINKTDRVGKNIEMDRIRFVPLSDGPGYLLLDDGERIWAENLHHDKKDKVSVRGVFMRPDYLLVETYHVHPKGLRDGLSYVGLTLVLLLWLLPLSRRGRKGKDLVDG